jgi:phage shock protein E
MIIGLSCGGLMAADPAPKGGPVPLEQAEKLMADDIQVLDVRTQEEWDAGHLEGAKKVTVTEENFLEKAKATLDPKKPVLVYCRSGSRSEKAAEILREAGFSPVYEMKGGIVAWEKAGKPVKKGD